MTEVLARSRHKRVVGGRSIAGIIATMAIAAGVIAPTASATAYPSSVWGGSLPANTWGAWHCGAELGGWPCPYGWRGVYDHVSAWYSGSGTVALCEQTQEGPTWTLISEICANNDAESGSFVGRGDMYIRARVKNNSGFTHTINGEIWGYTDH
jgi:hypothetical protein